MNKTNICIEDMTSDDLVKHLQKAVNHNSEIRELLARNQVKFICKYFSKPLLNKNGRYMKGTHLKDLLILYYVDYFLKQQLADKTLKIERYFDTILLNLSETEKITKSNDFKQKSFAQIVDFFKKHLCTKEQAVVVKEFNKIHNTNFSDSYEFAQEMKIIVNLRNFTLHHQPIVSDHYPVKGKKSSTVKLKDAVASLAKFINYGAAKRLLCLIKKKIYKKNLHFLQKKLLIISFKSIKKLLILNH